MLAPFAIEHPHHVTSDCFSYDSHEQVDGHVGIGDQDGYEKVAKVWNVSLRGLAIQEAC